MSIHDAGKAMALGMGLKSNHLRVLIRVGWVLLVSGHIAWVCGWLVSVGLTGPFARASDMAQVQRTLAVSARIQIQQELREQKRLWCSVENEQSRSLIMRRIDELRGNLREIANIDDGTGEPVCRRN